MSEMGVRRDKAVQWGASLTRRTLQSEAAGAATFWSAVPSLAALATRSRVTAANKEA
jgi:hypothetical protein